MPFSFSSSGSVLASLTFAGYGIARAVRIRRLRQDRDEQERGTRDEHEPRETDTSSVFGGTNLTHYADLRYKATNARDHDASA